MKGRIVLPSAWLLARCVALLPVSAGEPGAAERMWVVGWEGERAAVAEATGDPVEFTLVLSREMPTPGWSFEVDSVEVDGAGQRIVVALTERRPTGMVAQVLTTTEFRIPLGNPGRGTYFVEIRARPDAETPYQPAHALVIRAR